MRWGTEHATLLREIEYAAAVAVDALHTVAGAAQTSPHAGIALMV
jgi:hypothetical protein